MTTATLYPAWYSSRSIAEAFGFDRMVARVLKEMAHRTAYKTSTAVSYEDAMTAPTADTDATVQWATEDGAAAATVDKMASQAMVEMREYLSFGRGWDGYAGKPFDERIILHAELVLTRIVEWMQENGVTPIEITPCPVSDGSIDIEIGVEKVNLVVTLESDLKGKMYVEDEHGIREEMF